MVLSSGADTWIEGSHLANQIMSRVELAQLGEAADLTCFSVEKGFGFSFICDTTDGRDRPSFLCCITLGDASGPHPDAAKNGHNDSANTGCKSTGSQDHGLDPTLPSSSHSCWFGICQGTRMCKNPFRRENGIPEQHKHFVYFIFTKFCHRTEQNTRNVVTDCTPKLFVV